VWKTDLVRHIEWQKEGTSNWKRDEPQVKYEFFRRLFPSFRTIVIVYMYMAAHGCQSMQFGIYSVHEEGKA
jgi:hypothetical protein